MAQGLSCLTLAFILQQPNTIVCFEIGTSLIRSRLSRPAAGEKWKARIFLCQFLGGMGSRKREGEALVMEKKDHPRDAGEGRKAARGS